MKQENRPVFVRNSPVVYISLHIFSMFGILYNTLFVSCMRQGWTQRILTLDDAFKNYEEPSVHSDIEGLSNAPHEIGNMMLIMQYWERNGKNV